MKKQQLSKTERKNRISLTLTFSLIVFIVLAISMAISSATAYLFSHLGWMGLGALSEEIQFDLTPTLVYLSITSVIVGFGVTFLTIKYPLKPINKMINQMNKKMNLNKKKT